MRPRTIIDWNTPLEATPTDTQEVLFVLAENNKIRSGVFSESWQRIWVSPGNTHDFENVRLWAPMPQTLVSLMEP